MKRMAGIIVWLLAAMTIWGQGTVFFANDPGTLSSPPDRYIRFCCATTPGNVFFTNSARAVGTNYQVQLYYGASTAADSALIPVTSAPARLRASTTSFPGVWGALGDRTLQGFGYGSGAVKLQVRLWDINYGATYEQAHASGIGITATSASFLYQIPSSPADPPTDFFMTNFIGFTIGFDEPPPPSPPNIFSGPQNQTVAVGHTATFNVSATGTLPLSYSWRFNGNPISGATQSQFSITNVQVADGGPYDVVVTNIVGARTSAPAILTISQPITIVSQPVDVSVPAGQDANFSVTALGDPPLNYQWQFNKANIAGATASSFTVTKAQVTNSGNYRVIVSNLVSVVTSSNALLTVLGPPVITVQPTNVTVRAVNPTATFSVTAAGVGLTYQWRFNDADVSLATNSSLTLIDVQPTNAGLYSVVVSNLYGNITSSNAVLFVVDPDIAVQPTNTVAVPGSTVVFSVVARGTQPLNYQWRFNTANITDASNSSFIIPAVKQTNVGNYAVVVSNNVGSITSAVASLTFSSQGGTVDFLNDPGTLPPPPDRLIRFSSATTGGNFFGTNNAPAVGTNFLVQLYYGPTNALAGELVPVSTAPARLRPVTTTVPGTWANGGQRTLAGFPYGSGDVQLQARVWNVFDGNTYEQALLNNPNGVLGVSQVFRYTIPPDPSYPPTFFAMSNFVGFTLSDMPVAQNISVYGDGVLLTNSGHTFIGLVKIALQTSLTNGHLFYTFDGSIPGLGPQSRAYTNAFNVRRSVLLRTAAYDSGFVQYTPGPAIYITIIPIYNLTATTRGGGTVTLNPPGGSYVSNTLVSVNASPSPGWTFLGWFGDSESAGTSYEVLMNRNKCVEAFFGTTLNTTTNGAGSLVLTPTATYYPYGTEVQVAAIPQPGSVFGVWGNAAAGVSNPLTFEVTNANPTISGSFAALPASDASLVVIPHGRGQVTINPAANSYPQGANVTLTAFPDVDQSFYGWSGDAAGTQNPFQVNMGQSKLIVANFSTRPGVSADTCLEGMVEQGFRFRLDGEFGATYQILSSTDGFFWSTFASVTNTYGTMQIIDTRGTNRGKMFYRALTVTE